MTNVNVVLKDGNALNLASMDAVKTWNTKHKKTDVNI